MIKAVTRRGKVWCSEAGLGRARHGSARRGLAGTVGPGVAWQGTARLGAARRGMAGKK